MPTQAENRAGSKGEHSARALIQRRPRVSSTAAVVMSLLFALLATPLLMVDGLLAGSTVIIESGKKAPITVRAPQFGADTADMRFEGGAIVVARGQMVTEHMEKQVVALRADQPTGPGAWIAYMLGLFLLGLLYTTQVRRTHGGKLLRTQAITLLSLIIVALVVKGALLFTAMSILLVPVGGIAMAAAMVVDVSVGISTGVVCTVLVGLLTPFDVGVVVVLAVQAVAAVLMLGPGTKHKKRHLIVAGSVGGLAAATAYAVFFYLSAHASPVDELQSPMRSAWVAAAAGGVFGGLIAIPLKPVYQWVLGEMTRNQLVELEDLSNPLLKQISEQSPGSWQHSLAMANMAEIAANAIDANGRLVRVGAYYHDLGKSLQSSYFIENLQPGESSPHDRLAPEVSCDAIFAHVTEGVRLGRERGLPERIIDFMHMHHGDGLLEYFWAKCQEQGNPKGLTESDFRYPGIRPQTRETAILAICDAVEAASRTLKKPDEHAVRTLVERIVYGKLHLGQLDESGLSVPDLRKVSDSLIETIKHAYHGRIEYPWQRKLREEEAAQETNPQRARAPSELAAQAAARPTERSSTTQRIIEDPRLDSLDVPRPYWRERTASKPIEHAATERVSSEQAAAMAASSSNSMPAATDSQPVKTDPSATGESETVLLSKPKDRADTDPEVVDQVALDAIAETQQVSPTATVEAVVEPVTTPPAPAETSAPARDAAGSAGSAGSATMIGVAVEPTPVAVATPSSLAAQAAQAVQAPAPVESTLQGLGGSVPPAEALLAAARAEYENENKNANAEGADLDPESRIQTNPILKNAAAAEPGPIVKVKPAPSVPQVKLSIGRVTLDGGPAPAKIPPADAPVAAPAPPARPGSKESIGAPDRGKPPAQVLADLVASARQRAEDVAEAEVTLVRRAPTTRAMPVEDPAESSEQLAEWTDALEKTASGPNPLAQKRGRRRGRRRPPPPPPGSSDRPLPGNTIQLMEAGKTDGDSGPAEAPLRAVTRADSESDALSPGMMVMGPPPATHTASTDGTPTPSSEREQSGPVISPAKPAGSMMPPRRRGDD